jgi:hypothetical protein
MKRWGFRRYNALIEWYLENGPPVYVSVAAYLGMTGKKSETKGKQGDFNELLKMAGPGGMIQ